MKRSKGDRFMVSHKSGNHEMAGVSSELSLLGANPQQKRKVPEKKRKRSPKIGINSEKLQARRGQMGREAPNEARQLHYRSLLGRLDFSCVFLHFLGGPTPKPEKTSGFVRIFGARAGLGTGLRSRKSPKANPWCGLAEKKDCVFCSPLEMNRT